MLQDRMWNWLFANVDCRWFKRYFLYFRTKVIFVFSSNFLMIMLQIKEIVIFFLWSIEPIPEQCEFGTILTGDNGRPTCYFYHKVQHIYDFEMSKHYCEEFGGSLVTMTGPKDQENVFQMIQSGITASANSVMNLWEFR